MASRRRVWEITLGVRAAWTGVGLLDDERSGVVSEFSTVGDMGGGVGGGVKRKRRPREISVMCVMMRHTMTPAPSSEK